MKLKYEMGAHANDGGGRSEREARQRRGGAQRKIAQKQSQILQDAVIFVR